MITFKRFEQIINTIKDHGEFQRKFTDFLEGNICTSSWAIVDVGDKLVRSLIDLLCDIFGQKDEKQCGDIFSWWLWEDVDKIIYYQNGGHVDITDIKDFYDYLVREYKKHNP